MTLANVAALGRAAQIGGGMRKYVLGALLATTLLTAVAAPAGAAVHRGVRPDALQASVGAPQSPRVGTAGFVPLGVTLSGTAQIDGYVYSYSGAPVAGAEVAWHVGSPEGSGYGESVTDAAGAYSFTGLPAANGNGIVAAWPAGSSTELDYTGRSWADPGPTSFDFRWGEAAATLLRGGPWDSWGTAWVAMRGADGGGGLESYTDGLGEGVASAAALPGTYSSMCVNFWTDEGMELATDVTVTAGAAAQTGLTFDESKAQRLLISSPYWASGNPGTVVKLRLDQFPAGYVSDFYGYQWYPQMSAYRGHGSYTSQGGAREYKKITIPSTARPGFIYAIGAQHRDGLLDLETYAFQVSLLKGPKAAHGSYRLRGKVPVYGYTGEPGATGTAKWVYLYRRYREAGQPKGDPAKYGWKYVRRYRTDGTGAFTTRRMDPGRTAWYVLFYPGDDWYWPGFTSVWKVRHY